MAIVLPGTLKIFKQALRVDALVILSYCVPIVSQCTLMIFQGYRSLDVDARTETDTGIEKDRHRHRKRQT